MSAHNEAALERLAHALALGDGFQFHILVCHSPVQVRQTLTTLAAVVPAYRGGSLITRRLLPDTVTADRTLDSATLTATVTEAFAALPIPSADQRVLAVLDASFVAEAEIPAWRHLFRRLNEQRNTVADRVDAALLLCVSPTLEPIFAHEAPDFWSIRGVSVRLDAQPLETAPSRQITQSLLRDDDRSMGVATTDAELASLRQAVEALREQARAQPDDPSSQYSLAIQLGRLADGLRTQNQLMEAVAIYQEVQAVLEHLTAIKHEEIDYRRNLAVAYERLGDLMTALGKGDEARHYFLKALDIRLLLAQAEPQRADYQRDLSVCYNKLGDLMTALGKGDEARHYFLKALDIRLLLAQAEPQRADYQRDLSVCYNKLGDLMTALGKGDEARHYFLKALDIRLLLAQAEPQRADYQRDLSVSYESLGNLMTALGKGEHARDCFIMALDIRQRLAQAEPQRADYQRDLSVSYESLGNLMTALGKGEHARDCFIMALDIRQRLAQAEPQRADYQRDLIVSHVKLAENDPTQAVAHLEAALAIAQRLHASGQMVQGLDWMQGNLADRLAQARQGQTPHA